MYTMAAIRYIHERRAASVLWCVRIEAERNWRLKRVATFTPNLSIHTHTTGEVGYFVIAIATQAESE